MYLERFVFAPIMIQLISHTFCGGFGLTDCPGFVVNRILGIYMNEAGILCMEGQKFTHVDAALLAFGMPMGPFVRPLSYATL